MEKNNYKLIEKWQKDYDDSVLKDKMDIDNILYCEGSSKPLFRGYLHWFGILGFIITFFLLYEKCNTVSKKIIFSVWIFINIIVCKTSVILHTYDLNPIQEIRIQKLDHIMIYINIINHLIQYIFLFNFKDISLYYAYFILFISIIISSIGIYLTIKCEKKNHHLFFSLISLIIIVPLILKNYSKKNIFYFIFIWFFIIIGLIAYNIKVPISDIFGYHEFFHLFTLVSAFFSVLLEKSLLENDYNKY